MQYNYSDDYFKNFKKGRNPRNAFNPQKILGETPFKEITRKYAKPAFDTARAAAKSPLTKVPLTGTLGAVGATGLASYGLGSALDNTFGISEGISNIISPRDGKYNPNREPNLEYVRAMEAMDERARGQMLGDFNQIMDRAGTPQDIQVPIQSFMQPTQQERMSTMLGDYNQIMDRAGTPQDIQVPIQDFRPGFPTDQVPPTEPVNPNAVRNVSDLIGFNPVFEGQTLGQFMRNEDTPESATFQGLDPQGRFRQFTADGKLVPQNDYEALSAGIGQTSFEPKVGIGTEVRDTATRELSLGDYMNIARAEGATGGLVSVIAKQKMQEAEAAKEKSNLENKYRQGAIDNLEYEKGQDKISNERAERELSLRENIANQSIADNVQQEVGADSIGKLMQGDAVTGEEQKALRSYVLNQKENPLESVRFDGDFLDEDQIQNVLYGDGELLRTYTSQTMDEDGKVTDPGKPLTNSEVLKLSQLGVTRVIRNGKIQTLPNPKEPEAGTADNKFQPRKKRPKSYMQRLING